MGANRELEYIQMSSQGVSRRLFLNIREAHRIEFIRPQPIRGSASRKAHIAIFNQKVRQRRATTVCHSSLGLWNLLLAVQFMALDGPKGERK
jgi:hypothetical protein